MNVVLIVLAVSGFAMVVLACFIYAFATYVGKGGRRPDPLLSTLASSRPARRHGPSDRRSGKRVSFPLYSDGVIIYQDRRKMGDRRQPAF